MYRFLRCFLCLLIVCCLIINLSPIKADAMSGGLLAPLVSGAAVTVSAPVVIGAALIALGIMAGTNDDFQRVVGNAVDSLGDWVKDGTVELLQTVDTLGKKAYYVASDMMEGLRRWAFDTGVVSFAPYQVQIESVNTTYTFTSDAPINTIISQKYQPGTGDKYYRYVNLYSPGSLQVTPSGISASSFVVDGIDYMCRSVQLGSGFAYDSSLPEGYGSTVVENYLKSNGFHSSTTNYDLTLGQISSVPVDGSSAREWSEEYTNRGLYVDPVGDGDGNDEDGKWYWPLVLAPGVDSLTQTDQWTGTTPEDFDGYTVKQDYKIVTTPDIEIGFGIGIELDPVEDPDPGDDDDPIIVPGPGIDPAPDTGGDTGEDPDSVNWFAKIVGFLENIWNSILELPSKFATWFDNIISEIQELPSKFATWFENIISAIQELPSKFAEWFGNLISGLERIWESICNLPEAIGNILKSIFVPSEDFLTEKVQDLRNRFNWIEPIIGYGNYIKVQLVNPEPPVLYVHLGNAEGSYNYGGTVKFLDMSWYERYKSQGDAIISGFLWALFAWRMYVKLPGIINGVAGDVGHISYGESAWQKAEARKERKEKGGKNK